MHGQGKRYLLFWKHLLNCLDLYYGYLIKIKKDKSLLDKWFAFITVMKMMIKLVWCPSLGVFKIMYRLNVYLLCLRFIIKISLHDVYYVYLLKSNRSVYRPDFRVLLSLCSYYFKYCPSEFFIQVKNVNNAMIW